VANENSEQPGAPAQDSQPSFDDRLAALMGVRDDEEPEQNEEEVEAGDESLGDEQPEDQAAEGEQSPDSPQFEEVEFDGKTYQVPPELKSALMREADYTQKTQELAEMRRQVELQAQSSIVERQFQQQVSEELNRINILDAAISEFANANWAAMSTDELVRSRMSLDNLREQRAAVAQQVQMKQGQFQQYIAQITSEMSQRGEQYLQRSIPKWDANMKREVVEFALTRFSPGELQNIYDPRLVQTLWEAHQYRQLQSQTSATLTKARNAPPVVKPGSSNPMPRKTAQFLNYRKALNTAKTPAQRDAVIAARVAQKLFGK
jgi:hypothetical protein